ncbi:MAG: ATP-binding protein [Acidobacteria bacterium]|nr:MAG: ATP-binding protein [Acidobacteriota bacterium]
MLHEFPLSEVRLDACVQQRERLSVAEFLDEMAVAAHHHAECRGIHLSVEPASRPLVVNADQQLLAAAVMNLLNNAFTFTRPGGRVVLRAREEGGRLLLEVEDQSGGIRDTVGDPFQAFGERRGRDQTGLDLGVHIARKAVHAQGGDIHIRNVPGAGCVFVIDMPLDPEEASTPTTSP